jgi:hypothetical protein
MWERAFACEYYPLLKDNAGRIAFVRSTQRGVVDSWHTPLLSLSISPSIPLSLSLQPHTNIHKWECVDVAMHKLQIANLPS